MQVFGFVMDPDQESMMVMEFLAAGDLRNYLVKKGSGLDMGKRINTTIAVRASVHFCRRHDPEHLREHCERHEEDGADANHTQGPGRQERHARQAPTGYKINKAIFHNDKSEGVCTRPRWATSALPARERLTPTRVPSSLTSGRPLRPSGAGPSTTSPTSGHLGSCSGRSLL